MDIVDVVVKWAGTVIAVERLARGETFTIGAGRAAPRHFVWHHPALESARHVAVEHGADGVLVRGVRGGALTIDGAAAMGGQAMLPLGARASIALGAIEIAVLRASRARATPVARERDVRFLRVSGLALVVHAGFVGALLLTRGVPAPELGFPPTTRLIAEAWAARPPVPVARASAQAGAVDLPALAAHVASAKSTPKPKRERDARSLAHAALEALGLDGAGASTAFGDGGPALGGALHGMSGGTGAEGLAARRGDSGVLGAAISAGFSARLGSGAEGSDAVALPAKERVPVRVISNGFDHQDGLTRDEIARVMDRARAQVKACYERELPGAPDLEGKVVLGFSIAASGTVASTATVQNTLAGAPGARTGGCIERVVRRLAFPQPRGGGTVQVTYPFVLSVAGG